MQHKVIMILFANLLFGLVIFLIAFAVIYSLKRRHGQIRTNRALNDRRLKSLNEEKQRIDRNRAA